MSRSSSKEKNVLNYNEKGQLLKSVCKYADYHRESPYTQAEPLLELNNCRDFSTFASSISSFLLFPPLFGWLKWFKENL